MFFPRCIGAVDGSHYSCRCPAEERDVYRNRKGETTMNVCGVVDFTGRWLYILAGWEGSAHDQRVYNDAWDRKNLTIPGDAVLLGDGGYANARRTLVPYRGTRYHLQDYVRNELSPKTKEELFNLRHSQLRMIVERSFGRHKSMFKIFGRTPHEGVRTHIKLLYATAAIMNFVLEFRDITDPEFIPGFDENAPDGNLAQQQRLDELEMDEYFAGTDGPMDQLREEIAGKMWTNYCEYLKKKRG